MNIERMRSRSYILIFQAFALLISCFVFFLCFSIVGTKVSYELKWRYMKALLTKDLKWYEGNDPKELPYLINMNLSEVEQAIGKRLGFICFAISNCFSSFVILLISGFTLGACMLVILPFSFLCFGTQIYINQKKFLEEEKSYLACGSNAEQALSAIKVVKAFGQEQNEISYYEKHINDADRSRIKFSWLYGIGCGLVESLFTIPACYSLVIGGIFIADEIYNWIVDRNYNNGDQVCAIYSVQCVAYFIGISLLSFQSLNRGLICAGSIFKTINHVPDINLDDENSIKIDHIDDIIFENVVFKYSDRNQNAVDGVSLTFKKGKVTALVGPSGSGKTTIAKLLERFYDPQSGLILVNGTNLKDINLRDYRRLIGYVGQEPCLFNESIKNNLLNANPSATDEDIEECLKTAMAYDFVQKLPEGIESNVGALGNKLSGGQKQRIAIARALIRKPDLLILDEATSALDNRNEKYVQKAIDNINKVTHISTVVIAHRLTTIESADLIIVLENGKILEQGSHEELMLQKGYFNSLYISQNLQCNFTNSLIAKENFYDSNENEEISMIEIKTKLLKKEVNYLYTKNRNWLQIAIRLIQYNKPYSFIIIAIVGSTLSAICITLFQLPAAYLCIYFTKNDKSDVRIDMKRLISIAVCIGLLSSILQAVSRFCLAYLSSGMTKVIRSEIYKSLINKTALYFDDDQNSVGRIIEILAVQTKDLNGASVEQYINFYQGLIVCICCCVISVLFRWNEGLAVCGFIPFLIVSCFFVTQFQIAKTKKIYKYGDINKISENAAIHDCIVNNLTIASLSNEDTIIERYFINSHSNNLRKSKYAEVIKMSCLYAFSQFLITMFYVPMYFIFSYNVENKENIIHSSIPLVCGMIGGLYFSTLLFNSPDFSSGKKSANTIFNIIEEKNEGEPESIIVDGDLELIKEIASGNIEFKNIWFKYPTSCGDWVLKNFNLKIKAGTSVGLVGESGSGKSTLVQLLLRFYDPQRGEILIGGIPITKFTLNSLRRACGFVQQEPQIFDRSILENICYGKPHATVEEINQAAIMSNSKEFIENISMNDNEVEILNSQINTDDRYMNLDNGYKIICGPKGNKLSGGQKQRIAIARAVIRNPSILILDEATSALDEASQAVVQESINNLMRSTTSIVIAHRLSTLSRCDKIFKICEGTIVDGD